MPDGTKALLRKLRRGATLCRDHGAEGGGERWWLEPGGDPVAGEDVSPLLGTWRDRVRENGDALFGVDSQTWVAAR